MCQNLLTSLHLELFGRDQLKKHPVFAMLRTVWTEWVPVQKNQVLDQGFNLLFIIEFMNIKKCMMATETFLF